MSTPMRELMLHIDMWLDAGLSLESFKTNYTQVYYEKERATIIGAHYDASMEAGFEHSAEDWAKEYFEIKFGDLKNK
jgi:hypothetical protein